MVAGNAIDSELKRIGITKQTDSVSEGSIEYEYENTYERSIGPKCSIGGL
jgi:hypothetical protein